MTNADPSRREAVAALLGSAALTISSASASPTAPHAIASLSKKFSDDQLVALIVTHDGKRIHAQGDLSKPYLLHSMRKSMLSMLYGISVQASEINLDDTLAKLGLDDIPALTDVEKAATVRDLLKARSGVYIPASAEAPAMKARRPARGSHPPDTFWYYNNWDFNALGRIYEMQTGKSVFIAFQHFLAEPLGFQDFHIFDDTFYGYEPGASQFPAYSMQLSARDLERVGLMMLNDGMWNGKSIVPTSWIAQSTQSYSRTNFTGALSGYGYLWWIAAEDSAGSPTPIPKDAYTAAGAGGHFLTVIPSLKLVIVCRVNTFDQTITAPVHDPAVYSELVRTAITAI
jgi:CubicO group peptidase (beta-lactamase class C family)